MKTKNLFLCVLVALFAMSCTNAKMSIIGTWQVTESTISTDINKVWEFRADNTCSIDGWQQISEVRGEELNYGIVEQANGEVLKVYSAAYTEDGVITYTYSASYQITELTGDKLVLSKGGDSWTFAKIRK